jgi:DeoR/GlpR family transcriptional regulator of sugar metabolism
MTLAVRTRWWPAPEGSRAAHHPGDDCGKQPLASLLPTPVIVYLSSRLWATYRGAPRDDRSVVVPVCLMNSSPCGGHGLANHTCLVFVCGELNFKGPLTESSIRSLRFDTAILGCCGLSAEQGLAAHDLPEVAIKQAAIAAARRVIVGCDSGKFTRTAFGAVCALGSLDVVVTDAGIPRDEHDALVAAGVIVRIV